MSLIRDLALLAGLSVESRRGAPASQVLPAVTGLNGMLAIATAVFVGIYSPDECGTVYSPCLPLGKWGFACTLGLIGVAFVVVSLALMCSRRAR